MGHRKLSRESRTCACADYIPCHLRGFRIQNVGDKDWPGLNIFTCMALSLASSTSARMLHHVSVSSRSLSLTHDAHESFCNMTKMINQSCHQNYLNTKYLVCSHAFSDSDEWTVVMVMAAGIVLWLKSGIVNSIDIYLITADCLPGHCCCF